MYHIKCCRDSGQNVVNHLDNVLPAPLCSAEFAARHPKGWRLGSKMEQESGRSEYKDFQSDYTVHFAFVTPWVFRIANAYIRFRRIANPAERGSWVTQISRISQMAVRCYSCGLHNEWKILYNDPAETATLATDIEMDSIFASFRKGWRCFERRLPFPGEKIVFSMRKNGFFP